MSGYCFPATCNDGIRNQGESDIDCSGPCDECRGGFNCEFNTDCSSGICNDGLCEAIESSCFDGIKNNGETDVDCGGVCPSCNDGKVCNEGEDCISGNCGFGACIAASCTDNIRNQGEANVDCGGPCKSCIFRNEDDKKNLPYDGEYDLAGFGTTQIISGNADDLSYTRVFDKDIISYREEVLVENIIRHHGYGKDNITVEILIPKEFEVTAINYTKMYENEDDQTVIIWKDGIRGGQSRYYNFMLKYKEKYRLYFENHEPEISRSEGIVNSKNFIRVYEKRKMSERLNVKKTLVYKENTQNVTVVLEFENLGEVPIENILAYEAFPDTAIFGEGSSISKYSGKLAIPDLNPTQKYTITYETFREDNLSMLPEITGLDPNNLEMELIIDSKAVLVERFITFIKISSLIVLIFLALNTMYLYNVYTLKNKRKIEAKRAFVQAFYDTLLIIIEFFEKLPSLIKDYFEKIKARVNKAKRRIVEK